MSQFHVKHTKLNKHCSFESSVMVNAVKLLMTWVKNLVISTFSMMMERMSKLGYNIVRVVLLGIFVSIVGTPFGQLYAQTTTTETPKITIDRNIFLWHEWTGVQAEYIIISDTTPTADAGLTVNYEVVPTGGGNPISRMVILPKNQYEVRARVSESHSEVRITTSSDYTIGEQSSVTFSTPETITRPAIQSVFDKKTVLEGDTAVLKFRLTPPAPRVSVGSRPDRVLEFYGVAPANVSHPTRVSGLEAPEYGFNTEQTVRHEEFTFTDNTDVNDSFTLTITPDPSSIIDLTHAIATIDVIDDDGKPQVRIESDKTVITEGESIKLTVSALPLKSNHSPLTVNLTNNNSPYINNVRSSVSLTDTDNSVEFTLTTHDRTQMDGDGEIVITLSGGGNNYDLVNNKSVAKIKVVDKQTPRPNISTNNNSVNIVDEGASGGITFNIESDTDAPIGGLTVYYQISETGNLLKDDSTGANSVTISSGRSTSVSVELKTADMTAFSQDSIVSFTILSDINLPNIYLPAANGMTASVLIKDLGSERPSDGIFIQRLSNKTIPEGNNILFQVGAPDAIDVDRIIKINYGGLSTDNFLSSTPNSLITIPANLSSVNVSITTADDSTFDATGKFDISIAPAEPPQTASYTITSDKKSFEVTINDNDARDSTIEGVSIHAITTTITSENVVRFLLVAPQVLTRAHTYTVHVTERASDAVLKPTQDLSNCIYNTLETPNRVQCSVEIRGNTQTGEFEIELNDDSIYDGNSIITATIIRATLPEQNPTAISETNKSVMVTIMDDDAPPTLKLELKSTLTNNSIVETHMDQNIEFEFKVKTDAMSGITTTSSASNLTIQYSVIENVGNFLLPSEESEKDNHKTAQLDALATSVSLNVSVNGDAVDEINGNFTVTIENDLVTNNPKTYLVSQVAEENSITINVTDDDIPVLSVDTAKTSTSITEGENLEIVIKSDIAPYQDLDIELCAIEKTSGAIANCERRILFPPSSSGSFLPSNNAVRNVKFFAKTTENRFFINIDDDDTIEESGAVIVYFNIMTCPATVAIGSTQGFCSTLTSSVTASITVTDDDPEISIAALDSSDSIIDGDGSINEGDDAKFRITSNQPPLAGQTIDVVVNISQVDSYLDSTATATLDSTPITVNFDTTATPPTASLTVSIAANQSAADFTLKTITERTNNRRGSITAEIALSTSDPTAYSKDTRFSATTIVNDIHDPTPEIYIEAIGEVDGQTIPVRESSSVRFVLTATKPVTQDLNVQMCISDGTNYSENTQGCSENGTGDYLTDSVISQVMIPASSTVRTKEFQIELEDDFEIEGDGIVSAIVFPSSMTDEYRIHNQTSATVAVSSDDPLISIAAKSARVTEGTDTAAVFVVTTNAMVEESTRVRLKIEGLTGDFLAVDQAEIVFVEFTSSDTEKEKEIMVSIVDDEMKESNGSISVSLDTFGLDSANYFIVSDDHPDLENSASVLVFDDDGGKEIPTVSISSNPGHVTEGEDATFTLSTQNPLPEGITLSVRVNVEEVSRDFITGNVGVGAHTFHVIGKGGTSSSNFIVKTIANSRETDNGTIKVSIIADAENYIIDKGTAGVTVLDSGNLDKPGVSVKNTNPSNSIEQGQDLLFTISTLSAPNGGSNSSVNNLSVNLKYIQSGDDFILFRAPKTITIPSVSNPVNLVIKTDNNNTSPGLVTVEILPSEEFNVVSPNEATVSVTLGDNSNSNNDSPRVSVAEVAVNEILSVIANRSPNSNSPENSAPILPIISIAADSNEIEEGQVARFVLNSRNPVARSIQISVSITASSGTIERDLTRTIVMDSGQSKVQFEIPTIDDDKAEANGHITATLVQSPNYQISHNSIAVVTILDNVDRERRRGQLEAANREVIPNLHNALGATNWSNVSNRIGLALAGESQPSLVLGGQSTINEILTSNAQVFDNDSWTLKSFFGNSSFTFDFTPSGQGKSIGTVWGLGEQQTLSRNENDKINSWTADMITVQFGSDVRINDHGLVGLSVAVSDSAVDFGSEETTSIQYELQNNNFQSYLGWQSPDQSTQIRVSTGIGLAEIELNQDDYDPMYLQSTNYSLALQGNSLLYSSPRQSNRISSQVSVIGDSYLSQLHISETTGFLDDVTSYSDWTRLGFEVTNQYDFNPRQSIQVRTSFSGLSQREEDDLNLGLITQSVFKFIDQYGISISGEGQLLMHQEQQLIGNYGIKGEISFDHGRDRQGALFSMVPIWNFIESSLENQLMSKQIVNQNINELFQSDQNKKLTSEFGYGFGILDNTSRLIPFGGFEYLVDAKNKYHAGTRLQLGSDLKFELTGTQESDVEGALSQEIKLDGIFNW